MATTVVSNLINPEVLADFMQKKLTDKSVFAPLAVVDTTLVGRPGDTLTFPCFSYIGAAGVVAENSQIAAVSLQTASATCKVEKYAKGVQITDEAVLAGAGDPVNEIGNQLTKSLADAIDTKLLSILGGIASAMTYTTADSTTEVAVADISNALELFGEDIDDGAKVVVVSPALYTKIRNTSDYLPASQISAELLIKGAVGEIYGCQIIVSNRLKATSGTGTAYIVKPEALRLILKRDILIEPDREPSYARTTYYITEHLTGYLYDASKAIKIVKKSA